HELDKENVSENQIQQIREFIQKELQIKCDSSAINNLKKILNRPIRICGMVKNTGAPGGGPFWTKQKDGSQSLQIVELSQIDVKNDKQAAIIKNSSHFNPVDIICGIRDYTGKKFNLNNY